MRRLSTSLLIAVLVSIIGAGWMMDRLFVYLDTSSRESIDITLGLGQMLVRVIDAGNASGIDALASAQDSEYSVSLVSIDDIGLPQSLRGALEADEPLVLESDTHLAVYFKLQDESRALLIRLPHEQLDNTRLRLLLTLAFYILVAALLLVWLYPLVRRLRLLAAVAKRFGEGDLQQRIITSPDSSLYDIESEFNRMAQRLQALVEDNKMLSGAVSHDLRTPLARLRFGVDALAEQLDEINMNASDSSRVDKYLSRINNDLAAMEQLVEVLLEFARLDQQLSELPLRSVNLVSVVQECVDAHRSISTRSFKINSSLSNAQIMADERYASMLVSNLIQNAVKFSHNQICISIGETVDVVSGGSNKMPANQSAKSKLPLSATRFQLTVEDDGPGFDQASLGRITKPFEKGGEVLNSESAKSYGLGLAIVSRIAQWFGAKLDLGGSESLGGARVCVIFNAPG